MSQWIFAMQCMLCRVTQKWLHIMLILLTDIILISFRLKKVRTEQFSRPCFKAQILILQDLWRAQVDIRLFSIDYDKVFPRRKLSANLLAEKALAVWRVNRLSFHVYPNKLYIRILCGLRAIAPTKLHNRRTEYIHLNLNSRHLFIWHASVYVWMCV